MQAFNTIRKRTPRFCDKPPAKLHTPSWRSACALAEPGITHSLVGTHGESQPSKGAGTARIPLAATDVGTFNELAGAGAFLGALE
jgi:hypothetical protein